MADTTVSPTKRAAEESEPVEAKKPRTEGEDAQVENDDEEDPEELGEEMKHLDAGNIIEGGRRTRGKKIDFASLPDEEEEEEEDDEDADLDEKALDAEPAGAEESSEEEEEEDEE